MTTSSCKIFSPNPSICPSDNLAVPPKKNCWTLEIDIEQETVWRHKSFDFPALHLKNRIWSEGSKQPQKTTLTGGNLPLESQNFGYLDPLINERKIKRNPVPEVSLPLRTRGRRLRWISSKREGETGKMESASCSCPLSGLRIRPGCSFNGREDRIKAGGNEIRPSPGGLSSSAAEPSWRTWGTPDLWLKRRGILGNARNPMDLGWGLAVLVGWRGWRAG